MHIHLATDHAGFTLKEALKHHLETNGYAVTDHGAYAHDPTDDYPAFIQAAARAIQSAGSDAAYGIIFGGSGQGEAMAANRFSGIRAAVYYGGPLEIVSLSRAHNDTNILSLGARFLSESEAIEAVERWLNTPFSNSPRHERRLKQIDA